MNTQDIAAMTEAGESVREAGERIENEVLGLSRKLSRREILGSRLR